MQNESKEGAVNPIGLYKDPESGQTSGAINEIQADAMVQQGWKLVGNDPYDKPSEKPSEPAKKESK